MVVACRVSKVDTAKIVYLKAASILDAFVDAVHTVLIPQLTVVT